MLGLLRVNTIVAHIIEGFLYSQSLTSSMVHDFKGKIHGDNFLTHGVPLVEKSRNSGQCACAPHTMIAIPIFVLLFEHIWAQ